MIPIHRESALSEDFRINAKRLFLHWPSLYLKSSKNILVKALTLTLNIPIQENWFTNPLFMYHFIVYKFPVIFQLTQAKGTITKAQYNS